MALHNEPPQRHQSRQAAVDAAQDVVVAALDLTGAGGTEALAFTTGTNVNAATIVGVAHFQRVDDIVIVSGRVTIDTDASGATDFQIALPAAHDIANIAAATEIHGSYVDADGDVGLISGDITNETAQVDFTSGADSTRVGAFLFSYVAD